MLQSLNSGVSGLKQFQQEMDVIGNNIANVSTTGYKSARVEFADTFSQTLGSSSSGATSTATMQVGTGVSTQGIRNNYSQGSLEDTGNTQNMAINGNGYFVVKDTATGAEYATRYGVFDMDTSGYLTINGYRVQGFSDSALTTRGDLKIDATSDGTTALAYDDAAKTVKSTLKSYSISEDGTISVTLSDGNTYARGQVLLQNFTSPQLLTKTGDNLYSGLSSAGALATTAKPSTGGMGSIKWKSLESSNVDITTEFTNLITSQRAFQAASKVVTTADEILQEIVNLKR